MLELSSLSYFRLEPEHLDPNETAPCDTRFMEDLLLLLSLLAHGDDRKIAD